MIDADDGVKTFKGNVKRKSWEQGLIYRAGKGLFKKQQELKILEDQAFVDSVIKKGEPFLDATFPPTQESLGDATKIRGIEWARVSDLFQKPAIFKDGIEPNDIQQGLLGDCYFLAVLASAAEDPKDIKALFYTKEINKAGIYMVYFFINGIKRSVIVDDYLPCKNGKAVFARSRDSEVWVNLLEKAWAKLHGNYFRIQGGIPCHAASAVAGVPGKSIRHRDIETINQFKQVISTCDQREYTMIAATYGHGEGVDSMGIVAGHAYSLISYHDVSLNGKPVSLVKLRNPWG